MTIPISQNLLKEIALAHGISDAEFKTLVMALEDQSVEQIATKLELTPVAIRKRLAKAYQKFGITGIGPGKLLELKHQLELKYKVDRTQVDPQKSASVAESRSENTKFYQDWDEELDVDLFYGRTEELATLENWIIKEKCRLVAIYGLVSIGKTAFAVKLVKEIQDKFDYVIWRSFKNPPKPDAFLEELLKLLPYLDSKKNSSDFDNKLSRLIESLAAHRCLLVFDQVETILRSGTRLGRYLDGYEEYGQLFRRIGEEEHQSCLVAVTQEKIREINLLEGPLLPIRYFNLTALKEAEAKEILAAKGLKGEKKWGALIEMYQGNPLALKTIAQTIQEVFNGDVGEFIEFQTYATVGLSDNFINNIKRLSDLERDIFDYLAQQEHPVSILDIKSKIAIKTSSGSELISALESLLGRSLIKKSAIQAKDKSMTGYAVNSALKEYISKIQERSPNKKN